MDALIYKPTPRERSGGEKPYGPRPRERPVEIPQPKGRPVNSWEYEPMPRERPVGPKAYELMPEERPVANPKLIPEKLDTRDVRDLWAVRPRAIFVMMLYTLERAGGLTLRCATCTSSYPCMQQIYEGLSDKVSGAISVSTCLLDVTVMSSSGVIVSPSDFPVEQLQPLTTGVSGTYTGTVATPFVVPPSPDIEQQCRQLQDSPTSGLPESRQPWLITELSSSGVRSLPLTRRRGGCRSFRCLLRLTVSDLSSESRRV